MCSLRKFIAVGFCALLGIGSWVQADPPHLSPLVILISLDGFKPSYINSSDTPHLLELMKSGASAQGLTPVFPSLTFPNHVSMITGQLPDSHGIVNNTMRDPQSDQRFSLSSREAVSNPFWWEESRPIWVTAHLHGLRSATLFWPGSETIIQGVRPDKWLPYQHDMSHEERLRILGQWLDLPPNQRPHFVTFYLSDVDSAGHRYGPNDPHVRQAVQKVDQTIGALIQGLKSRGLWQHAHLIVASDHGMAEAPSDKTIAVHKVLKGTPAAAWEWVGPTSGVRLNGAPLEDVMAQLTPLAHMQCFPKAQLPSRWMMSKHRRIPDVVCLADIGYTISIDPSRPGPQGQHGYDPDLPDMLGILIAHGERIQPGKFPVMSILQVHPLLVDLLGIAPHSGVASSEHATPFLKP